MFQIGDITLPNRVVLASMADTVFKGSKRNAKIRRKINHAETRDGLTKILYTFAEE